MSCRSESRKLPPERWVTLRGGLCCRRRVKDAFHLPRAVVSTEQAFPALHSRHSPTKSPVSHVSYCMENNGSVKRPRPTLWRDDGMKTGEADSLVGKTQLHVHPVRQDQEQAVQRRVASEPEAAQAESVGRGVRRPGETWFRHGSVPPSLPAAAFDPSFFRLNPTTPSAPVRALAFPPLTSFDVSKGMVGRGVALPHDLMQQWQHPQSLFHFNTVEQEKRRGWTTQNQGVMPTSTTTASSPPHSRDSRSHTSEYNDRRMEGNSIHRNGPASVAITTLDPNNVLKTSPKHSREGQSSRRVLPLPPQVQQTFVGQQDFRVGRECATLPEPAGDQRDPSLGRKRNAADSTEGEEPPRRHDAKSEDISGAPSCAAPSAPPADEETNSAESDEEFFGEAAHYQYEDTPDNALLTNDDVRHQDVLCGRGAHATHHTGNRAFRNDISRLLPQYVGATKQQKTKLSDAVVKKVTKRGGRFLKRLEGTSNEEACATKGVKKRGSTYDEDNVWEVLSYSQSRAKVSQRFRQAASTGIEEGAENCAA